jgi:hypothetical protein
MAGLVGAAVAGSSGLAAPSIAATISAPRRQGPLRDRCKLMLIPCAQSRDDARFSSAALWRAGARAARDVR